MVSRPRLIDRLNEGLYRKLTLISAPAGFGKTTLLSEWINQSLIPNPQSPKSAWLSLDESDNDPIRFLTYFIASLQTLALSADGASGVEGIEARRQPAAQQKPVGIIGQGALSALESSQPPPTEAILTILINEIASLPDRIVLLLDDYQLIDAQPIHDALTFLLRHLPPQMHLVIATREDPPLILARLRAQGQLTELRATDLRFTSLKPPNSSTR
jgi:LuxR family maltose regulon positive regulatory protein